jgi:hypothetical protein
MCPAQAKMDGQGQDPLAIAAIGEVDDNVAMMVTFADRIFLQLVKEIPWVRSF